VAGKLRPAESAAAAAFWTLTQNATTVVEKEVGTFGAAAMMGW